jgi:lipopolysaccharide export system protein LptC
VSAPASSQRVRLIVIIALLVTAALGSFWILEVLRQGQTSAPTVPSKDEPDYSVEKFNFVRMSKTGQARYNISGMKLTHFPKNDTFVIEQPLLHNLAEGQAPMTLHAERAVIAHDKNEIQLQRHVKVDRPASPSGTAFHLRTDYLLVLPDQDLMKTDKPVEILLGNSTLNGTGMVANNLTREIHLASKVRGSFQPPSR